MLPSIIMSNVCSLRNKTNELQANVYHMHEYRTASILAFTETWLNGNDNDDALHINGFAPPLRLDCYCKLTGKQQGGGVCLYVNTGWCSTVIVREKLCTTDIDFWLFLSALFIYQENFHFFSFWFTFIPELMLL